MDSSLTKAKVRELLKPPGATKDLTDADLARFFGTSHSAIWQWPEDEAIPEGRQWELKAKRPELFAQRPTDQQVA